MNKIPLKKSTGPRLETSLNLLKRLNFVRLEIEECRVAGHPPASWASVAALRKLEAALEQNDSDGRDKVNARQLGLFTETGDAGVPQATAS